MEQSEVEVELVPKSKRCKERIAAHGRTMILLDDRPDKFLVRSIEQTWFGQHWAGWFRKNDEATFVRKVSHVSSPNNQACPIQREESQEAQSSEALTA